MKNKKRVGCDGREEYKMNAPRLWVWAGNPDDDLDLLRYVHATKHDILKQRVVEEEINSLAERAERAEKALVDSDAETNRAHEAKRKAENLELRALADLDEAIASLRGLVLIIQEFLPEQARDDQGIQDQIRFAKKLIAEFQ